MFQIATFAPNEWMLFQELDCFPQRLMPTVGNLSAGAFQEPQFCFCNVEVKGRPDAAFHAALCLLSKAARALRRAASNFLRVNASSGPLSRASWISRSTLG